MKKVAVSLLALALSACVSGGGNTNMPDVLNRVPTQAEKAKTADAMKRYLFDPYSVRDASISSPISGTKGMGFCLRYNAKNRFGAYIGSSTSVIRFSGDQVLVSDDFGSCNNFEKLQWFPFPELEAL